MRRHAPSIVAAMCVLGLTSFASDASALPISNDVNIDWSNGRFINSDEFVTINGMPRLISQGQNPGNLIFDIDVTAPDDLFGFYLEVHIVDAAENEYLVGGNPLILTYPLAYQPPPFLPSTVEWQLFINDGNAQHAEGQVALSEFVNFNLLPTSGDWIYLLYGSFAGDSSVGGSGGAPTERVPYTGNLRVNITASGVGTAYGTTEPPTPPTNVPEPATFSLLLLGGGASLAARLRRRR